MVDEGEKGKGKEKEKPTSEAGKGKSKGKGIVPKPTMRPKPTARPKPVPPPQHHGSGRGRGGATKRQPRDRDRKPGHIDVSNNVFAHVKEESRSKSRGRVKSEPGGGGFGGFGGAVAGDTDSDESGDVPGRPKRNLGGSSSRGHGGHGGVDGFGKHGDPDSLIDTAQEDDVDPLLNYHGVWEGSDGVLSGPLILPLPRPRDVDGAAEPPAPADDVGDDPRQASGRRRMVIDDDDDDDDDDGDGDGDRRQLDEWGVPLDTPHPRVWAAGESFIVQLPTHSPVRFYGGPAGENDNGGDDNDNDNDNNNNNNNNSMDNNMNGGGGNHNHIGNGDASFDGPNGAEDDPRYIGPVEDEYGFYPPGMPVNTAVRWGELVVYADGRSKVACANGIEFNVEWGINTSFPQFAANVQIPKDAQGQGEFIADETAEGVPVQLRKIKLVPNYEVMMASK